MKKDTKQLTIYVDNATFAKIKKAAAKDDNRPISRMVAILLKRAVKNIK